jgi:hypothetical protein
METEGVEPFSGEAWSHPIEAGVRERLRSFIKEPLADADVSLGSHRSEGSPS